MTSPPPSASRGLLLGIVLLSAATLAVQVLQTRLFSVMLWHHLTYMVVTITLLGFAAGGSLLAVAPRLARIGGDPRVAVSLCCSLFALTLLLAFALLAQAPLDTLDIEKDRSKYFWLFLRYGYLVVPFVFAGLAVAVALQQFPASVHKTYFWNLLGSGVGSFLFVLLIRDLGGPGCLFLFSSLGGAAALCCLPGSRSVQALLLGLLAALPFPLALLLPDAAARLLPIEPARSKALNLFGDFYTELASRNRELDPNYPRLDPTLRTSQWTPLCRLDTLPVPPTPSDAPHGDRSQVHVFQDGDAPTVIWSGGYAKKPASDLYDRHFYGLGYRLVPRPRVLIIGSGGGNDIETALHYGAQSVTAVDINGDTLRLVRERFGAFTDHVYERPGVTPVHAEGRSFLRRAGGTYDLLQMSGTDTYAALSSGSYILSESYLYTEEAFDDFFAHLSEDGVLGVIRFNFDPPRETLKLVATGARALKRLGKQDLRRHVLVVHQVDGQAKLVAEHLEQVFPDAAAQARLRDFREFVRKEPLRYAFILLRKRAFEAADARQIEQALAPMDTPGVVHHTLAFAGSMAPDPRNPYDALLTAISQGPQAEERFYRGYPRNVYGNDLTPFRFDVRPATDDRPFFFNFHHWSDVWTGLQRESTADYAALTGSEPIGLYVLAALLVQTTLATLLLVIAPLLRLGLGAAGTSRARVLVYFGALGLAYLLVEIATVQRFVLYLGHPTYSLTAGLTTFLVGSGLGSAFAGRLGGGRRVATTAALLVVALLLLHAIALPAFLRGTLALGEVARVALMVLWVAPLAFLMGMPFPTGMQQLGGQSGLIAWAFGINGAASVLSSILSIVIAMGQGFTAVFALAAALYGLAALTVPGAAQPAAARTAAATSAARPC